MHKPLLVLVFPFHLSYQVCLEKMGYKMNGINCNSLYDRVNKLLVSYEWSDCSFSVSGRQFKAHKLILAISSPVFEAMFYGPLASNNDISITDIEPEIFQLLLNYIYTDKVEISSIEESFELLYVSRKYLLEHLTEICISFIQSNMTVDNIITILNYPDYMQDHKLVLSALTLLCEHASYVLKEYLKTISLSCMKKILHCDNMNISEKCLIKHVFKWTLYQCGQSNDKSNEKRRSIMISNELFKLLRFAVLTLEDLNEIVNDENNLLLSPEADGLKQNIMDFNNSGKWSKIYNFGVTSLPRNPIQLQWRLCHRSPLRSMSPVIIDINNNSVQARVKVNKSVFIHSLSVPSRMAPEVNFYNNTNAKNIYCEEFVVSVMSEYENSVNKKFRINQTIEYDSTLDIQFLQPLFLKKDQWYTINFVWPRQTYFKYSYAVQSRERRYNNNKIVFQFEDLFSATNNGGSFLKGFTFCM